MSGDRKAKFAKELAASGVGVSDFAKKRAAAANQLSASTGNLTDVPSYAALRQMKSRLGASNRRDPDLHGCFY